MALYAIGDLHLSENSDKPMDIFGPRWENHTEKLRRGFSAVGPEDTVVVCGDLSWGKTLDGALEDFRFLHSLPGRKILLKGNHDYYWSTLSRMNAFCARQGFDDISFLHNNSFQVGDTAVCGSRGWMTENSLPTEQEQKILVREQDRLRRSLDSARQQNRLVFLHYPPLYGTARQEEFLGILKDYGVKHCIYGHIHGPALNQIVEGTAEGIRFQCVSADHIGFAPVRLN